MPIIFSLAMPETPVIYDNVEVLEHDGLGFTCRIETTGCSSAGKGTGASSRYRVGSRSNKGCGRALTSFRDADLCWQLALRSGWLPPSRRLRAMPETAVLYDDVEVLETDGLGLTCRIGKQRVFIGKYVPVDGTTVHRKGDRGVLALPRWFVEQQQLPLRLHLTDRQVEDWVAKAELHAAAAREYTDAHPENAAAWDALERARAELNAALLVRGRRHRSD
jgi:hypothetical protein